MGTRAHYYRWKSIHRAQFLWIVRFCYSGLWLVDPRWRSGEDNPADVYMYTKAVCKETWGHLYRYVETSRSRTWNGKLARTSLQNIRRYLEFPGFWRFEKWRHVHVGDASIARTWYVPESGDMKLVQRVPYPRVDDWESNPFAAGTTSDILEVDVRWGQFRWPITQVLLLCEFLYINRY
jgi:hypothetical protein